MNISTRPATPGDEPFLEDLLLETITEQLQAGHWPAALRETVVGMQCRLRRDGIRASFPDAAGEIIEADGSLAGWLVAARRGDEILLGEIMIRAAWQGQGIGSVVLGRFLAEAGRLGLPVRLNVNTNNPRAARLYERLGFRRTGGDEVNSEMEWRAGAVQTALPG